MKHVFTIIAFLFSFYLSAQQISIHARLEAMGLKNIAVADSSIVIDLMYAKADNFTGVVLYDDLTEGYLHPHALQEVLKAQRMLQALHPQYKLIVYDAARPMSAQQKMWSVVRGTPLRIYVSNPANGGGLHNYGLAVDVSILDGCGRPLDMGTEVDYLGDEAHITHEAELMDSGVLSARAVLNRQLLRSVMRKAGFTPLHNEWWHFNWCSRKEAVANYPVIP